MPPAASPKVATIAPGKAFVDALAAGILAAHGGADGLSLADVTVLLPTRRAVRSLREAFLRRGGGRAMLLPVMRAIGDVDDEELALTGEAQADEFGDEALALPLAVSPLRRTLLLARLIERWWRQERAAGAPPSGGLDHAVRLAGELARLLDQFQTARLDLAALDGLAPEEHAAHWQDTLAFLRIVTHRWPEVLAERGLIDPADRRNRMLAALAAQWRRAPPDSPVIAAGSTGSLPATADLLEVVASLPKGCVVLPGLDRYVDEESWQALDESHPQYGLKQLLDRLGLDRREVSEWGEAWGAGPPPKVGEARARLISEAMRPEATTEAWRALSGIDQGALRGLALVICPDRQAEASVIALRMRSVLDEAGRTAALVTSDRELARRVAAEMRRWGVEIDDSAGTPLADTPPGVFLRLIAAVASEGAPPVPLLALLKHPLACGGEKAGGFRARVRAFERACLRGPRPGTGFDGLAAALAASGKRGTLVPWLDRIARAAAPLMAAAAENRADLATLLRAHIDFAEWLAADAEHDGAARLWAGEAGRAAADFVAELIDAGADAPPIDGRDYAALLDSMIAGLVVRPRYGAHPRLNIWGPLEARLQHADLIILGGLNESSWPREVPPDPWLSRPMRRALGLPLDERMIGLAAHDFSQLFCAPEVLLTRSAKREGTPTVASRWLVRLETVLRGAGLEGAINEGPYWTGLHRLLDRPEGPPQPIAPPAPCPPVEARPRRLSVTRIERWMADPYDIFARNILGLAPLDAIDADPGAADYGSAIHDALDRFVKAYPDRLPEDALARLREIGRAAFGAQLDRPGLWAFWWPRFERVAAWFLALEKVRRPALSRSFTELSGHLDIEAPHGRFTLTARADRIDLLADGGVEIIDYKTGAPPTKKDVCAGYAPQLPLEAAIVAARGFPPLPAAPVSALTYVRLRGGEPAGEWKPLNVDAAQLAAEALDGLKALVAVFDDPKTPYRAVPVPAKAPRYSDYEHLARVREWSVADGDGG